MKKFIKVITMLVLLSPFAYSSTHINSHSELQEAINSGENVIIDFYASWCIPCQQLGYNMAKLDEDAHNVKIYKVNVDEFPELQAKYVRSDAIPAILFVRDGQIVKKSFGVESVSELEYDIDRYFN